MKRWLIPGAVGLVLGYVLMGLVVLAVVEFGLFDVRASTPHKRIVAWAAHKAMIDSMRLHSRHVQPPERFTPADVVAGFHAYDTHCVMCHGGPGVARAAWVKGMTPSPPYIVDSARFWTPAELFTIVNDGVKMTAMPAWGDTLGRGRVWNVVAFLEALPYLSPRDYDALRRAKGQMGPVFTGPKTAGPVPAQNG